MEGMPKPAAESGEKKKKMGGLRALLFGAGALTAAGAMEPAAKSPSFEAQIPPAAGAPQTSEKVTLGLPAEFYDAHRAAAPVEPQTTDVSGTPETVTVDDTRQTIEMTDTKPTVIEMNEKKTIVGPPQN